MNGSSRPLIKPKRRLVSQLMFAIYFIFEDFFNAFCVRVLYKHCGSLVNFISAQATASKLWLLIIESANRRNQYSSVRVFNRSDHKRLICWWCFSLIAHNYVFDLQLINHKPFITYTGTTIISNVLVYESAQV